MTVDELIASWPADTWPAVSEVRRLVTAVAPDAVESARPGWNLVGYTQHGYVCGVYPHRDMLRFLFERGAELHDPDGVLAGSGATRHVDLGPGEALPAGLEALVAQAFARDDARGPG